MKNKVMMILTVVVMHSKSNAQIIYTDVNPDSIFSYFCPSYPCFSYPCDACGPHYLDLNNDNTNDFQVNFNYGNWSGSCMGFPTVYYNHTLSAFPLDSNSIASTNGDTLRMFMLSENIGPQVSWGQGNNFIIKTAAGGCGSMVGGAWADTGYAGLKMKIGNMDYYGWARIFACAQPGASGVLTYILLDYAYNNNPNQFIVAGDTGTGPAPIIETDFQSKLYISPNPFKTSTTFSINSNLKLRNVQLKIFDLTGRVVKQIEINNRETKIARDNLLSGIYLYKVQSRNEIIGTGKLIVQ